MEKKEKTRLSLLQTGAELFLERGYTCSGLGDILERANIPKGSFYFYFPSKEDFGLAVVRFVAEGEERRLTEALSDRNSSPLARLRAYFERGIRAFEGGSCRHGCPIGRLCLEMADRSDRFREELDAILGLWTRRVADCLAEAQAGGELAGDLPPDRLAELWLAGWQGALLRAKAARSAEPLRRFLDAMLQLLRSPANSPPRANPGLNGSVGTNV